MGYITNNINTAAAENTAAIYNNPYIIENENVIVDLTLVYDISKNDKDFVCKIIHTFLKNMPDTLNQIGQNLSKKDWENVSISAHLAKSSLSVVKIAKMFDCVLQIEKTINNKENHDTIPALVIEIKEQFLFASEILNKEFPPKIVRFNNL